MLADCGGFKRVFFYAKFYVDFYANLRQALYFGLFFMVLFMLILKVSSLFWLIFYGNFYANFKGKLFILPHNIYYIKMKPRVAEHLKCSTNGLFINKCTNDCLVTMLRSLLTRHRETMKDQRVYIYHTFFVGS